VTRAGLSYADRDLPRTIRIGSTIAYLALAVSVVAFIGVIVLASSKADRADARSKEAQRQSALVVCALADAQRIGNPEAPAPSTERGAYTANVWEAAFDTFGCFRFPAEELARVGRSLGTPQPTSPPPSPATPNPAPTPGG
jgi:hypothetical protein